MNVNVYLDDIKMTRQQQYEEYANLFSFKDTFILSYIKSIDVLVIKGKEYKLNEVRVDYDKRRLEIKFISI